MASTDYRHAAPCAQESLDGTKKDLARKGRTVVWAVTTVALTIIACALIAFLIDDVVALFAAYPVAAIIALLLRPLFKSVNAQKW